MRLVHGSQARIEAGESLLEQHRVRCVERQRDEVEPRIPRPHALPVDHAGDPAVADEQVVRSEVPVDDRVRFGNALGETADAILAAREELARGVGVVAERRQSQVGARAGEHRRRDDAPPRAGRSDGERLRMKLVQREQLRRDLLREPAPRLERLPRQLLL